MSVSFDAARSHFLQGVALFEAGDAAGAEQALLASLELLPGRPSTLVNLGAVRLRLGRAAEALTTLDQALAVDDAQADAWCHRALACSELGREGESLVSLQRAFALGCTLPAALHHHAVVLNRLGRHEEALAPLQQLLQADPRHASAQVLLGQTLQTLNRLPEARAAYEAATTVAPWLAEAWVQLGLLLNDLGDTAAARQALQRAREAGGDAPLLAYFSAAVGGGPAPASAPPQYVRLLFDPYAEGFEQHLVEQLHYRGHEAVVQAAAAWQPGGMAALALDLGCGSGLCGPLLRLRAQRVEGVDLSPTMVAQARRSGAYDLVHEAELVQHLNSRDDRAGLIVAADVFIYIGDLAPVFAAVARVLAPGGVFAFTVEHEAGEVGEGDAPFVLRRSLRYAHREAGLRALAAAHGLVVRQARPLVLREEQRQPVAGLVLVLQLGLQTAG